MPLYIVRNNIANMATDAVVNAANEGLKQGGGVCGAIFKAAGEDFLRAECDKIGACATGDAVITPAGNLKSKYIIHTVGPVWKGGKSGEEQALRSCYLSSLELAKKYELESIAFPIISSGVYGYPKAEAIRIASDSIESFLKNNDMHIWLVVFEKNTFAINKKRFDSVKEYISNVQENYYEPKNADSTAFKNIYLQPSYSPEPRNRDLTICAQMAPSPAKVKKKPFGKHHPERPSPKKESCAPAQHFPTKLSAAHTAHLEKIPPIELDESFSEAMLRLIDEKGMTDAETYKKANIDRKLFNKIKNNKFYQPRKSTALAFAIALELNYAQTQSLLSKAGFTLSHSNKFDIIIEYFIVNGIYNTFEINETLFEFEQPLLGT